MKVRKPAVAGQFYPGNSDELRALVCALLAKVQKNPFTPKALIVPHAGYVYSGPIAASAFIQWQERASTIRRIVLLGPSHHEALRGLALSSADFFATPLGQIPVDHTSDGALLDLPFVAINDRAHQNEHSLEIQLPFLQVALGAVPIIPLVVGHCDEDQVARVLQILWGGVETVIVISTDLTHYLTYDEAQKIDALTAAQIVAMDLEKIGDDQACGSYPLRGFLQEAQNRHLTLQTLDLRNSGDTAGNKKRVVGYGAWSALET